MKKIFIMIFIMLFSFNPIKSYASETPVPTDFKYYLCYTKASSDENFCYASDDYSSTNMSITFKNSYHSWVDDVYKGSYGHSMAFSYPLLDDGYVKKNSIITTSQIRSDILNFISHTGNDYSDFFVKTPVLAPVVEVVNLTEVMDPILEILPIVVSLIVSFLALRKCWSWLSLQLRQS